MTERPSATRRLWFVPRPIDAVGWLSVYQVVLLFVPSRLVFGPLGSAGAPSLLMGMFSLLLWCLLRLGGLLKSSTGPQSIRIALGIFALSIGISYVSSMSGAISSDEISPADVALLSVASWAGTLLITHDGVRDRKRLDTLLWRLCVCGGLIAFMGLIQVVTRRVWVDQISIPGLSGSSGYGLSSRGGFPRPPGFATHPIEFGTLVTMILPIALYVGFHQIDRRPLIRWLPAAALVALIPLTSSRSAYLGAAIGTLICMIGWTRVRRLRIIALIAAGLLAMSVIVPNLLDSIINLFAGVGDDPSIQSRTDSFSIALQFIERKPLFGRGLGTFLPEYRIFDNEYLLLLVTVGIVGAAAFLFVGITGFAAMVRLRRRLQDDDSRDLAMALAASIATGFSCLFMFDAFAFPMTMGLLFYVLGLAGALRRVEDDNMTSSQRRTRPTGAHRWRSPRASDVRVQSGHPLRSG